MAETFTCIDKCCKIRIGKTNKGVFHKKNSKKAGAFIVNKDRNSVLLVQSRGKAWGSPKGTVEEDETQKQCAVREIQEETGISLHFDDLKNPIRIGNALYYYCEREVADVYVQSFVEDNDANGIMWIKIECLKKLLEKGMAILNSNTKQLFRIFLDVNI